MKVNADGIDWVLYTSGAFHVVGRTVYARILPATATRAKQLFTNGDITVQGHYSVSKDKLVGYSLTPRTGGTLYVSGPTAVGVIFDPTDGDHTNPEVVFDASKIKLYRFVKGGAHNYAISLRGK